MFFFCHICILTPSKLTYVTGLLVNVLIFLNHDLKIFTNNYVL
jgi:hypothetical protein